MHAYQYCGIGIDNSILTDEDGFQCSIAQQVCNDDYDDEPLLKKLCVLLCMPQNVPECTSQHLILPGGSMPVNNCRVAMFSTSAQRMTLLPQMEKAMHSPAVQMHKKSWCKLSGSLNKFLLCS